jgi:hypothetical protein
MASTVAVTRVATGQKAHRRGETPGRLRQAWAPDVLAQVGDDRLQMASNRVSERSFEVSMVHRVGFRGLWVTLIG